MSTEYYEGYLSGASSACQWQPIETAPRDGTVVLVANATLFAAAYIERYVQPEVRHAGLANWPNEWDRVPNERAGEVDEYWVRSDPDGNDDHPIPISFDPTHWMMPELPK